MEIRDAGKKRALNMVWTAADRYDFEPQYLFFYQNDEPSLYLNTAQGLAYTCMDEEVIQPLCAGMECGRDPDAFRTLTQLVLEHAVFNRCRGERPGLVWLRRKYANTRLAEMRAPDRYTELSWERQVMIRCYRILEKDTSVFYRRELDLADRLEQAALLPDQEMCDEIKAVFWHVFMYRFMPALKRETVEAVGAGFLLYWFGKLFSKDIHATTSEPGEEDEKKQDGLRAKLFTLWKHLLSETTDSEDYAFINENYGPCLYSKEEMHAYTEAFCSGYHLKSRIWYADVANVNGVTGQKQEEQRRINRQFYKNDQRFYERSIRRITERLRHALEEQQEPDVVHAQSGRLDAAAIYRASLMHDLSVFRKEVPHPVPDFTVDILMDASCSRVKEQSAIAAQAYMITKSLENLGIPVQVTCFHSIKAYTVLQRMKGYEPGSAENLFGFYAVGANRDGLALDAYEPLMDELSDKSVKRILLVLTDGLPADTRAAYSPGLFNRGEDYDEDLAVEDTAAAIRRLRKRGVEVAAIFLGDTYGVQFLKRMYGSSFARIMTAEGFPDAVIGLLLRILNSLKDRGE